MSASPESVDVVILTVLPAEYKAVCDHVEQLRPAISLGDANLYAWKIGEVPCLNFGNAYTIGIGMLGRAGNPQSALATVDALKRWKPRYILFVGIAGGLSGLNKGDVVIADVVHGYEYGKIENVFNPRDNWTYKADIGLLNGANAHSLSSDWHNKIRTTPPVECLPKVVSGEVASGDKVVDDPSNDFFAQVTSRWPKLSAVEMEGAGVGAAIEQAQSYGSSIGFLMIRGISDLPRSLATTEQRGTQERDSWKDYAAATAAAFTISFVTNGLPMSPARSAVSLTSLETGLLNKLDKFGLRDEDSTIFGESEFTSNLTFTAGWAEPFTPAKHYVILAAVPLNPINSSATGILSASKKMLESGQWYNARANDRYSQPKYWPHSIFDVPTTPRSAKRSLVWEDEVPPGNAKLVLSRLVVTDSADVMFVSAIRFVRILKNRVTVYRLGRILAECWMFAGLVAQLQQDIGYTGQTCLCISMVNTADSHLGDFASGWLEPTDGTYWRDAGIRGNDQSCHASNLKYCETVNLLGMRPKEQPDYIRKFGEAISLAYNHDTPRCFDKKTGLIPEEYFSRY
ncbi:hypothetical protein TFLX_04395 [Thermoflexales bacterium]|nr:hypothetical protein TFLX_04395 [Thermoflexales bacterium]